MIHCDNGAVRLVGRLPEILDDFTVILIDLHNVLEEDYGSEAADNTISILGKIAFLDTSEVSYSETKKALYDELVKTLIGGVVEKERG